MNEQKQIKKILSKYSEKSENKKSFEYLVELDKKVSRPAQIFASSFGIVAALILGVGMCMCLEAISGGMILGCIIGCFGLLMAGITYPIYNAVLDKSMKSHKKEILSLGEKLLKEDNQ